MMDQGIVAKAHFVNDRLHQRHKLAAGGYHSKRCDDGASQRKRGEAPGHGDDGKHLFGR